MIKASHLKVMTPGIVGILLGLAVAAVLNVKPGRGDSPAVASDDEEMERTPVSASTSTESCQERADRLVALRSRLNSQLHTLLVQSSAAGSRDESRTGTQQGANSANPDDVSASELNAALGPELGAAPSADDVPEKKYFGFTDKELKKLASRCEVKYDTPPWGSDPNLMDASRAMELGLAPQEREAYNDSLLQANAAYERKMRQFYEELTGDKKGAQNLDVDTIRMELRQKSTPDDLATAHRRISSARAGLVSADPDRATSVYERYLDYVTREGDSFSERLSKQLSKEKVDELRSETNYKFSIGHCDPPGSM